jgi:hypothetical protein
MVTMLSVILAIMSDTALGLPEPPKAIDVRVVTWGPSENAATTRQGHILIRNLTSSTIEVARLLENFGEMYGSGSKGMFVTSDGRRSEYPRGFVSLEPGAVHLFKVTLRALPSAAAHGEELTIVCAFAMRLAGEPVRCEVTYVIRTDAPEPKAGVSIVEVTKAIQRTPESSK